MLFAEMVVQQDRDLEPAAAAALIGFVCVALIAVLVTAVFFLLTLSRCLAKCSPRNRSMEPGQVWLNLIPCFNIVWQFVTLIRVSNSLRNEFEARRIDQGGDYGQSVGMAALLLNMVSNVVSRGADAAERAGNESASLAVTAVSLVIALPALICFIIYWVKVAGYSRQLDEDAGYGRDSDGDYGRPRQRRYYDRDDENDDSDRPRRRDDRDDDR